MPRGAWPFLGIVPAPSPELRRLDGGEVVPDHRVDVAFADDPAVLQHDACRANPPDSLHVMADEQRRSARGGGEAHPSQTALLELGGADREDFVDDQDRRLEESGDREAEPDVHAG